MRLAVLTFLILVTTALGVSAGEIDIAREALRDGLWSVARTHAEKVDTDEAKLVVLESLAGEGKWDKIGERLQVWSGVKGVAFDYYRAVVCSNRVEAAAILKAAGSVEGITEARLFEAEQLAAGGDSTSAAMIWREIAEGTNVSERAMVVACANLMDAELLRKAYAQVKSLNRRRLIGLRLGVSLMDDPKTAVEGERLVRTVVKDSPDAEGAKEAFLKVADGKLSSGNWQEADSMFREAVEVWPDAARLASVQEGRGWALQKLGRLDEALEAFRMATKLADDDGVKAVAMVKEGDVLGDLGRTEESMAIYREVMARFPKTTVAEKLGVVVRLREQELDGRRLYREFRFADAMKKFAVVAEADSSRRQRMLMFKVLCLYGLGNDDEAVAKARSLIAGCPDAQVRADAIMWLAKFLYNRREWKESGKLFSAYAESAVAPQIAAEALLWASRAALADGDYALAIKLSTKLSERYPDDLLKPAALMVQGEALLEQARFDEAVLVFERVSLSELVDHGEKVRAQMLKADSLYAMGADNPARYSAALDAYRSIEFAGATSVEMQLEVAFKIARSLEKLKRMDEAIDQYYVQVVLAYRNARIRGERLGDEARAVFSRAAFRLADEYESRGRDHQAINILKLVVDSDVPASQEARKRIELISGKGGFL